MGLNGELEEGVICFLCADWGKEGREEDAKCGLGVEEGMRGSVRGG